MSATTAGDTPKRTRAPRVIEKMGVERDLGRLDGAVKALEDRADRSETETRNRFISLEEQIKLHAASTAAEFKSLGAGQQQILLAMNSQTAQKGVWSFLLRRAEFLIGIAAGVFSAWISRTFH